MNLQVTNAREATIELRCLMSARSAATFDLRCKVREQLIDFLQKQHSEALPRQRSEVVTGSCRRPRARRTSGLDATSRG